MQPKFRAGGGAIANDRFIYRLALFLRMSRSRTASEDQPGPMRCFQRSFGGEVFQSVLMVTSRTMLYALKPRKPGQSQALR